MATRHDISGVPLQGGYVAKQCPVRAQNDTLRPAEPLPPDHFSQRLIANGNGFETEVVAALIASHHDAAVIRQHGEDAEAAMLAAMHRNAPLILGGRLLTDKAGRRVGRPDILIAADGGGYRAVDVKWHQNLEPTRGKGTELPALCSSLDALSLERGILDDEHAARKRADDLLQLAHYQRLLEAMGMQTNDGRWAGIIGTERRVVWYDLDAAIWRTASSGNTTKLRTTTERYDFEFDFRLDVVAVAEQHKRDPSVALLTVPVKISECESCPWWDYCRPQLERPPGDLSLLPRIGWIQWKLHRDHGISDRAQLASLDPRTARLVAAGIDVAALIADRPIKLADAVSEKALRLLASEGINAAHDVERLCPKTASYSDVGLSVLPAHIDLARAALGSEPVYRRRGVRELAVRRADIELDIDMESTEQGCYLWGSYLTCRHDIGIATGYRAFATWEPLTSEVEAGNSLRFWRWLMDIRHRCSDVGMTFAAYCYNASAENTYLRRLAVAEDALTEGIEQFIASGEWIDLLKVWDLQLLTGGSSSLKAVAPLAGYRWRVDDAGGGESMIKHDLAVERDVAARDWVLSYNQGDVEATLAVREWMASAVVPGIEEVGE